MRNLMFINENVEGVSNFFAISIFLDQYF